LLKKHMSENNLNAENLSQIQSLAASSIEGQDPSWKNALTRKFVEFEKGMGRAGALEEYEHDQRRGFWYSRTARKAVNAATFFSGYILLGESIQNMDPAKYDEFTSSLISALNKVGLEPDTNFFLWQMSDFFGAAYYAFCATPVTRLALRHLGEKRVFGKDSEWWEGKTETVAAFTTGVILTSYEALQAAMSHKPIDVQDMAAYIAGLGLYLGSEKIWKEYQIFKKQYGSKLIPFLRDRKGKIGKPYAEAMQQVVEVMPDE
jgi:hypothetical protein